MHRRTEYRIVAAPGQKADKNGETTVFADEIHMTGTGDVVFSQVREATLIDTSGARTVGQVMATVLVLTKGTFEKIYQVNKDGGKLYSESGLIETKVQ